MAHRFLSILRRRLFTALSVLSLLLCVATLALWVRSYWRLDIPRYIFETGSSASLESLRGQLQLTVQTGLGFTNLGFHYDSAPASAFAFDSGSFLGFYFRNAKSTGAGGRFQRTTVPHWSLALLFAILPALRLRAVIRSRRLHRAGHCPRCGYDLRATPERCPECGTERVLATDEHR